MKVTTEPPLREREFESFTLIITVENKDEACFLYHLFNISKHTLQNCILDGSSHHDMPDLSISDSFKTMIWEQINHRLGLLGLTEDR